MQLVLIAQNKRQFLEAAEKEYADKNFYGAMIYYNTVLEFDSKDPDILFKAAESARQFNAYSRAAEKYRYLVDTLNDDRHPEASFWLGQMNQKMGNYDEATKYYEMYASEYAGQDTFYTARVKKELASLIYAKSIVSKPKSNVKLEKLGEDINTPSSDIAANIYKDDLYFSSMRFFEAKPEKLPSREVSKIFKKSNNKEAEILPGYVNNRDLLVSNSTITSDGTKIYYTVCNYINGSDINCEIYRSNLDPNGNLSDETRLPDPINLIGSTTTHPHISMDKTTGKEVLFFSSDRAGGSGGLDIWYSLIDPKFGFSQPVNIKEINTYNNEITPFYNISTDFLFFSSEGRESLGGYDIYKAGKTNDAFGSVLSLGIPYNSSYNDIYYFETSDGNAAYLSSNREGSLFLDDYFESCCYDIYKMDLIKIVLDLNALTFDKLTNRVLKKATVILKDKDSGQEIARFRNDDGNDHKFPISEDRNYLIIAERENYYPDTLILSTVGMDKSESITKKMFLSTDMMLLDVFTFAKIGKLPLIGTTVTLIGLTDQSIKDIVEINTLSNEYNFMLDRGKQYKIIATKDGFTEAIDIVDTRPYDKSGLLRRDLYLDKFVLQDLLPISLYFDNDLPDIASRKTTTNSKYGKLAEEYINRKQTYKEKFTKPLAADQRENAENEYEIFFEGDINGGYDKFKLFTNSLKQELEAGNKVELILKGYASPRADSKYNLALGQRRVNSVKNEMIFYGNEELKAYFLSGQLVITDISFGKELAPADVVGSIKDERNSIYNIKAAKERRVEILRASRNL
ncbi:MAG: hypothetical protein IPO92_17840 [Saprospiraceae bacterium]|nr:hypothetical protein [Saprospiraceae bacterium]